MAKFKVGDRVRVLPSGGELAGMECVVRSVHDDYCGITPSEPVKGTLNWFGMNSVLAPLTPPADEQWAADKVKQVTKPQHMEPAVSRDGVVIFP